MPPPWRIGKKKATIIARSINRFTRSKKKASVVAESIAKFDIYTDYGFENYREHCQVHQV